MSSTIDTAADLVATGAAPRRSVWGRLYHGETAIDFYGRRWWGITGSAVLIVVTIVSLFVSGLNLGIDFEGGVAWEVPAANVTTEQIDAILEERGIETANAKVQELTSDSGTRWRVQVGDQDQATVTAVQQAFADQAGVDISQVASTSVSSSWGESITEKAVRALIIFLVLVALFISWRFEWQMALSAIIAMVHDVLISVGVYSVFQFEVTPATVVAFLTILGFSLYDTIVVFDKVKENQARVGLANRTTYTGLMNLSLNQTLMRSVNTTLVTIVPVLSILLIGAVLLGAVTLEEFGFALLIGLVSGAYSSIVVAASAVAALKEREPRNKTLRERLEKAYDGEVPVTGIRHVNPASLRAAAATAGAPGAKGGTGGTVPARPGGAPSATAIPPRPRKKKKR